MQQNLIFRFCLFCMPNPVWKETERGGGEAVYVQQHENARRREPSKGSRTPRRNLAFLSFHHACVNAPAGVVVTATSTNKHQISLGVFLLEVLQRPGCRGNNSAGDIQARNGTRLAARQQACGESEIVTSSLDICIRAVWKIPV